MEFLILSVLGLMTFGLKEAFSAPEAEADKKSDKAKGSDKKKAKDQNNNKNDDDDDDEDEAQKTPEQELMEAFAKYESNQHKDKRIKINYEIVDKL